MPPTRSKISRVRRSPASTDVRSWGSVEHAIASCTETFGGIDFVIANAGIGDYSSLDSGDPERWRRVIETNLLGVLHTVRAALPAMKAQGSRATSC